MLLHSVLLLLHGMHCQSLPHAVPLHLRTAELSQVPLCVQQQQSPVVQSHESSQRAAVTTQR
jgi:hypothetical protein